MTLGYPASGIVLGFWVEISKVNVRVRLTAIRRGFELYECLLVIIIIIIIIISCQFQRDSHWLSEFASRQTAESLSLCGVLSSETTVFQLSRWHALSLSPLQCPATIIHHISTITEHIHQLINQSKNIQRVLKNWKEMSLAYCTYRANGKKYKNNDEKNDELLILHTAFIFYIADWESERSSGLYKNSNLQGFPSLETFGWLLTNSGKLGKLRYSGCACERDTAGIISLSIQARSDRARRRGLLASNVCIFIQLSMTSFSVTSLHFNDVISTGVVCWSLSRTFWPFIVIRSPIAYV